VSAIALNGQYVMASAPNEDREYRSAARPLMTSRDRDARVLDRRESGVTEA
jgi:hypothetical protein